MNNVLPFRRADPPLWALWAGVGAAVALVVTVRIMATLLAICLAATDLYRDR